jgi:hypothetical protein
MNPLAVAVLFALLCAIRADQSEDPLIVAKDGGVEIRLRKDATATVKRTTDETVDLLAIESRLSTIEGAIDGMQSKLGNLPTTLKALVATIESRKPDFDRMTQLQLDELKNKEDLQSIETQISNLVEASVKPLRDEVASLGVRLATVRSKMGSNTRLFESELSTTLNLVKQKTADELATLRSDLLANAGSYGASSIITVWNRLTCTNGEEDVQRKFPSLHTLYGGLAWGSSHSESGTNTNVCLKALEEDTRSENSNSLSSSGYRQYGDHPYNSARLTPLRTSYCSNGYADIPNCDRLIVCAVCHAKTHCYDSLNSDTCEVEGYEPVYKGYLYGQPYNYNGNLERMCVASENINAYSSSYSSYTFTTSYAGELQPVYRFHANGWSRGSVGCAKCCRVET